MPKEKAASTKYLQELLEKAPAVRIKEALLDLLKTENVSVHIHSFLNDVCIQALQVKVDVPKKKQK
jgi:hypothetical protein